MREPRALSGAHACQERVHLAGKLLVPGRIEAVAGVNLPMLVRAFTYRAKGMDTMIKKAISGGCDGVLHVVIDDKVNCRALCGKVTVTIQKIVIEERTSWADLGVIW